LQMTNQKVINYNDLGQCDWVKKTIHHLQRDHPFSRHCSCNNKVLV
jgi:hypothetical protein